MDPAQGCSFPESPGRGTSSQVVDGKGSVLAATACFKKFFGLKNTRVASL